ncbi:hypothetical protein LTS18_011326, partial [Coniosporium uncinatum]
MAQSKRTKKFEKTKLKGTLERRKEVAKIKQKKQLSDKKKARRAKDNEKAAELEDGPVSKKAKTSNGETNGTPFEDMTVDDFFQGGFEVPELPKTKSKKMNGKAAESKSGKRKRSEAEEEDH